MIELCKAAYPEIKESALLELARAAVANGKVFAVKKEGGVFVRGEGDIQAYRFHMQLEKVSPALNNLYQHLMAAKDNRKPPRVEIVEAPARLRAQMADLEEKHDTVRTLTQRLNALPQRPSTKGLFGRKKKKDAAAAWDRDVLPKIQKLKDAKDATRTVIDTILQDLRKDPVLGKEPSVDMYGRFLLEPDLSKLRDALEARAKELEVLAAEERAKSKPEYLKADPVAEKAARKAFIKAFLEVRPNDRPRMKKAVIEGLDRQQNKSTAHTAAVKEIKELLDLIERMKDAAERLTK